MICIVDYMNMRIRRHGQGTLVADFQGCRQRSPVIGLVLHAIIFSLVITTVVFKT